MKDLKPMKFVPNLGYTRWIKISYQGSLARKRSGSIWYYQDWTLKKMPIPIVLASQCPCAEAPIFVHLHFTFLLHPNYLMKSDVDLVYEMYTI